MTDIVVEQLNEVREVARTQVVTCQFTTSKGQKPTALGIELGHTWNSIAPPDIMQETDLVFGRAFTTI
jgi:hypothetical protein